MTFRTCTFVAAVAATISQLGCTNVEFQSTAEGESVTELTAVTESNELWINGRKIVSDGERTVRSGRKKVREGRDMIRQGDNLVERGLQRIAKGRNTPGEAVEVDLSDAGDGRPLEKGAEFVQQGNELIRQGNEIIRQGRVQIQEGRMMIDSGLAIMQGVESIYQR